MTKTKAQRQSRNRIALLAFAVLIGSLIGTDAMFDSGAQRLSESGLATERIAFSMVPGMLAIGAASIFGSVMKSLFPSGRPSPKDNPNLIPWSGKSVLILIATGIAIIITGIVVGSTGYKLVGIFMAVGVMAFSAPMMGEKSRLDHILEAADERAAKERTDSGKK